MKIKQKLKKNVFWLIIVLTALVKIMEWSVRYFTHNGLSVLKDYWYIQIGFILIVAIILFVGFDYMGVKKKTFLLIPVLAYFIKELYNFLVSRLDRRHK